MREDPKIMPHRSVTEVDGIYFYNVRMNILGGEFCASLPYVKYFNADHLSLESVMGDAFNECKKLQTIRLEGNFLTSLPLKLFDSNVNLTIVRLGGNKLTQIDGWMFKNNPNLQEISINDNKLQNFWFSTEMPVMTKLQLIDLSYNQLLDLDVETLLEKCPNLKSLHLKSNQISCDRAQEITQALQMKKIEEFSVDKCFKMESTTTRGITNANWKDERSNSSLIFALSSVLVILILGMSIAWGLKRLCKRSSEATEAVEEIDLDVLRNNEENRVPSFSSFDSESDSFSNSMILSPQPEYVNHNQVLDLPAPQEGAYDRLRFNRFWRS